MSCQAPRADSDREPWKSRCQGRRAMKICVFGAGAMGGLLGARLAAAGQNVSLVARGSHLAAMRRNGLRLGGRESEIVVTPPCTDNAAALGIQDVVVLAVKATALRLT